MKRGVALAMVLGAVIAAAGAGWWFGRSIESPAEAAARAEPPTASLITVAVEKTALSSDVVARGDIVFDDAVAVSLSGSIGETGALPIVTSVSAEGSELSEGSVMVEVAGRPVFLLQGPIPAYRDLRPGAEGIDVLQVESALSRLGHFGEAPDETWTAATGAAVQSFYDAQGYRAKAADDSDLAALEAARTRVRSATSAVSDAELAVSQATGAARSEILAAEAEVARATDDVRLATLRQSSANAAAERDVAAAQKTLGDAKGLLQRASDRLASAQAGTHPDTGLPPTAEELAALAADKDAATAGVATAQTTVTIAKQTADQVTVEQASLVRQAQASLDVAQARLVEVNQPPDRTLLSRSLDSAKEELAAARGDLASLEATVGTWIPAGEMVFLERVPVRVDRVAVVLGSSVSGSFMTVTGSDITLRVQVREADVERLELGDVAYVEDTSLEAPLEGKIVSIAERGTAGRIAVEVELNSVPDELVGKNVKVAIPIESTEGEVLAVPAAALSAVANGSVRVEVETAPGVTEFVTVVPGLAAGGLVEITPVDGDLAAGDRVVVGQAFGTSGG